MFTLRATKWLEIKVFPNMRLYAIFLIVNKIAFSYST